MKVLFLANKLSTVCGVSKHLYYLLEELKNNYSNNEYYLLCGGGDSVEKFEKLGIIVLVTPNIKHENRTIIKYMKAIYEIYNFAKINSIEVIHSHHHYAASIAMKASKLSNIKTVLTNHGILPEIGFLNHFDADYIIAINEHIQEYLLKNKVVEQEKIIFIRLGFPERHLEEKRISKIKIIAGGRFVKDKGFDVYIKAVAGINKSLRKKVRFFIAGNGEEEKELRIINEKENANVRFLGKVNDFQKTLCRMDVFIMTSRSKSEGFPTVLIEAGIANNLVISTNFRGLLDVLSKKEIEIVNVDDIISLSRKLEEVILNYESFRNKILNFNLFVKENFNQKYMTKNTIDLYAKMIKSDKREDGIER